MAVTEFRVRCSTADAPLAKLPHVMFFGGGVVIKLGEEVIGGIGAAGAPGAKTTIAHMRASTKFALAEQQEGMSTPETVAINIIYGR
jgi:hypothetical protein